MLGLWVRRAPLNSIERRILSIIFKPIIKLLIHRDKKYNIVFNNGQMITGLYGIAKK